MKKRVLHIGIYAGVILIAWVIAGLGTASQKNRPCKELVPIIHDGPDSHFLDHAAVQAIVTRAQGRPVSQCRLGEIKVGVVEDALNENPYVREAQAWKSLEGELIVRVDLKAPVARVIREDGSGFYLDQDFNPISLSNTFTPNTILLRGYFGSEDTSKLTPLEEVKKLVLFINKDEFLRSQISEIVRDPKGILTFYPEVGGGKIVFGKPEKIKEKFDKLKLFYREVLNRIGWDKYKSIDLRFKGQVVATKRV